MAMDTIFAALACYLLALSFAVAETEKGGLDTLRVTDSNVTLTHTTTMATLTPNSTVDETVTTNLTENSTPFTGTTQDNGTSTPTTAAPTESSSHVQTSQATVMTPLTNSASVTTTTPDTHTPTLTSLTTLAMQTTVAHQSTSDNTALTTANSSHTVNTTSDSLNRTTQALRLNSSEMNMTILFSAVLGVFAMALVVFTFHKCKQKIQYLHQPLNNTDDTDAFGVDGDTLVISGGLYDGHPIYDNVPTPSEDQSQFRLEFLH